MLWSEGLGKALRSSKDVRSAKVWPLSLIPQNALEYEQHQVLSYFETRVPQFGTLVAAIAYVATIQRIVWFPVFPDGSG